MARSSLFLPWDLPFGSIEKPFVTIVSKLHNILNSAVLIAVLSLVLFPPHQCVFHHRRGEQVHDTILTHPSDAV